MELSEQLIPSHALTLDPRLAIAVRAAVAGGKFIREGYGKKIAIREKGIGDLVSEIDLQAETAIISVIRNEDHLSEILSEETLHVADPSRLDHCWIIDPLDGSGGFLFNAGIDIPSVLIAHEEESKTVCGVMYFPLTGQWYYAVRGKGAFRDNGHSLVADNANLNLSDSWVDMNHYGDALYETNAFVRLRDRLRRPGGARLITTSIPHSGIAAKIIGGSELMAVIHDNNRLKVKQDIWDVAAPQIIVEEAGGAVIDLEGKKYNKFNPKPFIVARSLSIAKQIAALSRI